MNTITIKREQDHLEVTVPQYPAFGPLARALDGKVVGILGGWTWHFSLDREADVRDVCREVYGHDGDPGETVTCRVAVPEDGRTTLWALGRRLAWRDHRSIEVSRGEGVSVVRGAFSCAGDGITTQSFTVLEVTGVPAEFARREALASGGTIDVEGEHDVAAMGYLVNAVVGLSKRVTGGKIMAKVKTEPNGERLVAVGDATAKVWPGFVLVSGPRGFAGSFPREHDDIAIAAKLLTLAFEGFVELEVAALRENR